MSDYIDCFQIVCVGALFGLGIRWGYWIYDGLGEIFSDLKKVFRRR